MLYFYSVCDCMKDVLCGARRCVLLSVAGPVEKVGPLRAGLLAADPEHCRYSDHQCHQVLYQKQGEVRTFVLCSLK